MRRGSVPIQNFDPTPEAASKQAGNIHWVSQNNNLSPMRRQNPQPFEALRRENVNDNRPVSPF